MEIKRALEGIRVLDLTRVLAGPFCGMILGDLGADVIKIEMPNKGDDSRESVPKLNGESAYFMCINRNKRGITLNLKSEKGKQMFLELVKKSDVVLENFRPGVMDKLGLGYEVLKQANEGIVYAAISGFGHTGPYKLRAGFDIVGQAMSGMMSTSGWPDGGPTRAGAPIGDTVAGLNCVIGILSALRYRDQTGKGQVVDIALVDSLVSIMPTINMLYLVGGKQPERMGNRYANAYPYDSFKASDGEFVLAAPYDAQWTRLCQLIGRPELAKDPMYYDEDHRIQNFVACKAVIEEWTTKRTTKENLEALEAGGFACAPVYNLAQAAADEQIAQVRDMYPVMDHPKYGKSRVTNNAIKLSLTPSEIYRPSPELGGDNAGVYGELLDIGGEELAELAAQGVI